MSEAHGRGIAPRLQRQPKHPTPLPEYLYENIPVISQGIQKTTPTFFDTSKIAPRGSFTEQGTHPPDQTNTNAHPTCRHPRITTQMQGKALLIQPQEFLFHNTIMTFR